MHRKLVLWGLVLLAPCWLRAQLLLTAESMGTEIPNGPAQQAGPMYLLSRDSLNRYSAPDVTTSVTFSLGNMQQEAVGVDQVLTFGAAGRDDAKWPSSEPVFQAMRAIGKTTSKWFNEEEEGDSRIEAGRHYGAWIFASVKQLADRKNPKAGEKVYYGDLQIAFNRPVTDPVLHLTGLGGLIEKDEILRGYSVELELITPGARLEKISGTDNFSVSDQYIANSQALVSPYCGKGAACGSARVRMAQGDQLSFKVWLKRDKRNERNRGKWPKMLSMHWGDGFVVSVSFDQDLRVEGKLDVATLADTALGAKPAITEPLYANIVDSVSGLLLASKRLLADGSFSINGLSKGPYTLQFSALTGITGQIAPAVRLPAGWILRTRDAAQAAMLDKNGSLALSLNDRNWSGAGLQWWPQSLAGGSAWINPQQATRDSLAQENMRLAIAARDSLAALASQALAVQDSNYALSAHSTATQSTPSATAQNSQNPKNSQNSDSCFIIVGSFIYKPHVGRMKQRLLASGYAAQQLKGPANFTRVGYPVSPGERDKELAKARQQFAGDAWVLEPKDLLPESEWQRAIGFIRDQYEAVQGLLAMKETDLTCRAKWL